MNVKAAAGGRGVGHTRPCGRYELPIEYFLSLGWDADRWNSTNTGEYTRLWAAREFGSAHAADIADVVSQYSKFNGRRKPELLNASTHVEASGET